MKNLKQQILLIGILLYSCTVFAQQQGINYKALIKDANGNVLSNTSIRIQFNIQYEPQGFIIVYSEDHLVDTDANGIVIATIGNGNQTSEDDPFSDIEWSDEAYYLNVEVDISGGTNYVDMGTTQFMAVPYAKYANTATNVLNGVKRINDLSDGKSDTDGSSLFLGLYSGLNDDGTDNRNVSIGYQALTSITTGSGNVALGYNAGYNETGSNKLYIANSDTTTPLIYGEFDTERLTINGKIAINTDAQINSSTSFTIRPFSNSFGGMYIDSPDSAQGKPFYGYSIGGIERAWSYFDASDQTWNLYNNGIGLTLTNTGHLSILGGLEVGGTTIINGGALINTNQQINGNTDFTIKTSIPDDFGGMYIDTPGSSDGKPFYGYAIDGIPMAYSYYNASDNTWRLNVDSFYDVLIVTDTGHLTLDGGLDVGGSVRVNGSLVHSSDKRLKKDIEDLPYGLKEILQLQPKAYNWKDRETDNKSLGLIAQDVQTIIKEIVNAKDDEQKTLGINYTELIPILINAIQEQQTQIETLKTKNQNKDTVLAEVLKRLNTLENQSDTSKKELALNN